MNRLFKKILLLTVIVALFANAPVHAWSWNLSSFSTAIQVPFYWAKEKITNVLWPKSVNEILTGIQPLKYKPYPKSIKQIIEELGAKSEPTKNTISEQEKGKEKVTEPNNSTGTQASTNHIPAEETLQNENYNTDPIQGSTKKIKIVYQKPGTQLEDRMFIELAIAPDTTIRRLKEIIAQHPEINVTPEELQIEWTGHKTPADNQPITDHPLYHLPSAPSFLVTQKPNRKVPLHTIANRNAEIRNQHLMITAQRRRIESGPATNNPSKINKLPAASTNNIPESNGEKPQSPLSLKQPSTPPTGENANLQQSLMVGKLEKLLKEPKSYPSQHIKTTVEAIQCQNPSDHNKQNKETDLNFSETNSTKKSIHDSVKLTSDTTKPKSKRKRRTTPNDKKQNIQKSPFNITNITPEQWSLLRTRRAIYQNNITDLINEISNKRSIIQDKDGNTAFHYAVQSNKPEIVAILLLAGIDTESKNNNDQTALEWLMQQKNKKQYSEILKLLNPINQKPSSWTSFLSSRTTISAMEKRHLSNQNAAQLLIDYALQKDDLSIIEWVVKKHKDHLIMSYGERITDDRAHIIDVNAQYSLNGKIGTLLDYAEYKGGMASPLGLELYSLGAKRYEDLPKRDHNTVLMSSSECENPDNLNSNKEDTRPTIHVIDALNNALTPYSKAMLKGSPFPANILHTEAKNIREQYNITGLNNACKLDTITSMTPLHWVIGDIEHILTLGNTEMLHKCIKPKNYTKEFKHMIAKILLDWGADPRISDKSEGLPLTHAALAGQDTLVLTLIKHGADINAQDRIRNNKTALESLLYKEESDNDRENATDFDIACYLIRLGAKPISTYNKNEANKYVLYAVESANYNQSYFPAIRSEQKFNKTIKWQTLTQ